MIGKTRVCKCGKIPLPCFIDENDAGQIEHSYCAKCGEKFIVVPDRIIGVLVKTEGRDNESLVDNWITIEDFRELLRNQRITVIAQAASRKEDSHEPARD